MSNFIPRVYPWSEEPAIEVMIVGPHSCNYCNFRGIGIGILYKNTRDRLFFPERSCIEPFIIKVIFVTHSGIECMFAQQRGPLVKEV